MRIRTIKPEFWTDSLMVRLPRDARLVYIGLWNAADDHGWLPDDPDQLRMMLFPGEPTFDFETNLELLVVADRVERHLSDDGHWVLKIVNWEKHQRVDHPSKSKLVRESSRKLAIPFESRRGVAIKYGCKPGGQASVKCYFCDLEGQIVWHKLYGGRPSAWVTFGKLELDHFTPESAGGGQECGNFVLSCRFCNRSRGTKDAIEFLSGKIESSRVLAPDQGSGIRDQGPGIKDHGSDSVVILRELNLRASREFRATKENLKLISARLAEVDGDVEGIKKMIARMVAKWGPDPKMAEYLRPQTLFGAQKFPGYYDNRNLPIDANHNAGSAPGNRRKNFTESAGNAAERIARLDAGISDSFCDDPPPVDLPGLADPAL